MVVPDGEELGQDDGSGEVIESVLELSVGALGQGLWDREGSGGGGHGEELGEVLHVES